MLMVQPVGGLCNRMRAIDAACAFAQDQQQRVAVIWYPEHDCNARFGDLFEMPKDIPLVDMNPRVGRKLMRHGTRLAFSGFFGNRFFDQHDIESLIGTPRLADRLRGVGQVYLRTHSGFWPTPRPFVMFQPVPALRSRIETFGCDDLVGVHIRRTDNELSIRHSPTAAFAEAMEAEIERDPQVRFFLATDDPGVENEILTRFAQRVLVQPKLTRARNTPEGIGDAVVDLYALANCRKLLGSYWSSFTETASQIRRIDCRIVGSTK